jgi:hypothetical protein
MHDPVRRVDAERKLDLGIAHRSCPLFRGAA